MKDKEPFTFERKRASKSRVLESWYDFYNKQYYESALPKVSLYWYTFRKPKLHASTVFENGDPVAVLVSRKFKNSFMGNICLVAMLHEMAHVVNPEGGHDEDFDKEQARLFHAGAYKGLL